MADIQNFVMKNDLEGLKRYVDKISDVVSEDATASAPSNNISQTSLNESLKWSCFKGHEEMAEYLLELGADASFCDEFGTSMLNFAARGGFERIVVALLKKGAHHTDYCVGGESLLHWASRQGFCEVVKTLLEEMEDLDVGEVDDFGHMAIHAAAIHGQDLVLEYLLKEKWFSANIMDQNGWTALHYVCSEAKGNFRNALAVLLNHRADPMFTTPNGKTALDLAFETGIANSLIEILTLKKIFRLLIYADNIVPPSRTSTASSAPGIMDPAGVRKVSNSDAPKAPPETGLKRKNTFLHRAVNAETPSGSNFPRFSTAKTRASLVSTVVDPNEGEANAGQSKFILSMWKKIFQNDDVYLLSLYRDSNSWQDPVKPSTFEQTQVLKKDQMINLFFECYENGLGVFSFIDASFHHYIEQGHFRLVMGEISGIKSNQEAIIVDDFVLFPPLDQSFTMLALITGRLKLVEMLLRMRQFDLLPAALIIVIICRRMTTSHSFPDQVKDALQQFAAKIESIAVDALSRVFLLDNTRNKEVSLNMLHVPLKTYGNLSIIDLADLGQCSHFLSLPCCQAVLDQRWYGHLSHIPRFWRWLMYAMPPAYHCYLASYQTSTLASSNEPSTLQRGHPSDTQNNNSSNTTLSKSVVSNPFSKSTSTITAPNRGVSFHSKLFMSPTKAARSEIMMHQERTSLASDVMDVLHSPSCKFCYHSILHVVFLILFSYVLLRDFHFNASWKEWLCVAFVVGYTLEDLRQCIIISATSCFTAYLREIRNWIDMAGIFFTVGGFAMHFALYELNLLPIRQDNITDDEDMLFRLEEVSHMPLYSCRVVLLVGLLLFYIRFLFIVTISPVLGPRLTMMSNMLLGDLLPLSLIFALFIAAFGVVTQALLYPNAFSLSEEKSFKDIAKGFVQRSFYSMFAAEFPLPEYECHGSDCPNPLGSRLVMFGLHAVFVFSVNISLINLLIGLFSNTVARITTHSTAHWLADRYKMVEEYKQHSVLPPPFNIATCVFDVLALGVVWLQEKRAAHSTTFKNKPYSRSADNRTSKILSLRGHLKNVDLDVIVRFVIIQSFALKHHRYQLGERTGAKMLLGEGLESDEDLRQNQCAHPVNDAMLKKLEDKFLDLAEKTESLLSLVEKYGLKIPEPIPSRPPSPPPPPAKNEQSSPQNQPKSNETSASENVPAKAAPPPRSGRSQYAQLKVPAPSGPITFSALTRNKPSSRDSRPPIHYVDLAAEVEDEDAKKKD